MDNIILHAINLVDSAEDYSKIFNVAFSRWGGDIPLSFFGRVGEDDDAIDICVSLQSASGIDILSGSFSGVVLSKSKEGLTLRSIDAANIKGSAYKLIQTNILDEEKENQRGIRFFEARVIEDRP